MTKKELLLTEEAILKKLRRFAAKVGAWTFSDHPYQLQAEEAAALLKMLEKNKNDTEKDS